MKFHIDFDKPYTQENLMEGMQMLFMYRQLADHYREMTMICLGWMTLSASLAFITEWFSSLYWLALVFGAGVLFFYVDIIFFIFKVLRLEKESVLMQKIISKLESKLAASCSSSRK